MLRQITIRTKQILSQPICTAVPVRLSSSVTSTAVPAEEPKKEINKAMRAYLERAKEHDEFMQQQQHEYQIGKRHLANMMGENPETFTQQDVDDAIAYLFPSGLFEKKARPFMKPPEEVFPQRKAAEFDEMGRPNHFLFYTGKPNFYKVLYDLVENINECHKFEDIAHRKNMQLDPNLKLDMTGYQWLDKQSLEKYLVETIGDKDYESFTTSMERLCALPYSYRIKDFIDKYRRPLMSQTKISEVPKPQYDKNGRAFITTYECLRKRARGHVTVTQPGTGLISINDQDLGYFGNVICREQDLTRRIFMVKMAILARHAKPPELLKTVKEATTNRLPEKSKETCISAYHKFT